ncbi:uncharacterized protein NEMAJ01_1212 [Nematocida major]|uniref:uncharacterized protein n=1 Tax=Nematocida major TaxID=1912982 RepID=UPI0020080A13|nr:uncharacterized protein NEMAJ01_1212 [Nematocida major]KAH9386316.1 hypothetical protein NEMAJ01_1212 [Nematocida major]
MQASQYIRQLSAQIKQHLKQCEETGKFSSEEATKVLENALLPLAGVSVGGVKKPPRELIVSQQLPEDPYIYVLICKYLCSQNALESARTLAEEMDEAFPAREQYVAVRVLKEYCPWSEELGIDTSESVPRTSQEYMRIAEAKKKCWEAVRMHKEHASPNDAVSAIYRHIEGALEKMQQAGPQQEQRKEALQTCLSEIRAHFLEEHGALIYFDGKIAHVYSKRSTRYREILMVLGLLVHPSQHKEARRLVNARKVAKPESRISLETFYYVGKKMEATNISPYENEIEVESAVPSVLAFHSTFFCPILRCECSVDNAPCVLFCGHIISIKALEKLAALKGSVFKCPYCPKDVDIKDVFKVKMCI